MSYKRIESSPEEVLRFMREAGIKIEKGDSTDSISIKAKNGNSITFPENFNLFKEDTWITETESVECSCEFTTVVRNADKDIYVLESSKTCFEDLRIPASQMIAA